MEFISVRDFRTSTKNVWEKLRSNGKIVVTNHGKPQAIMLEVSDATLEETLDALKGIAGLRTVDPPIRDDKSLLADRPQNFPEIVRLMELGVPAYVINGDFLDEFYQAPAEKRQSFIDFEPPQSSAQEANEEFYAHCAAMAEKLAHDYHLLVPDWTNKLKYFLAEPSVGGFNVDQLSDELVQLMYETSPREFARHNLYVTSNALVRY